jgi:nitrate reductase gamma subunit
MDWNMLLFVVFPYLALTTAVVGHIYRYKTDPLLWNARSSELLEKEKLRIASNLFHYGIIPALAGHVAGLLVPQSIFDAVGISGEAHTELAIYLGAVFGVAALLGNLLLLWRRVTEKRVFLTSTLGDFITAILLLVVIGVGTYNVFFGHYYVLDTIAPWIRGILILRPDPSLMVDVPPLYKLHVLSAFALFAFAPFSRMVHIWSAPLSYIFRCFVLLRKRGWES